MSLTFYKVGIGHNVAAIDLDVFTPYQPKADFVTPVERHYSISGVHYDEGNFLRLFWKFIEDATDYAALLALMDLVSNEVADVTVMGYTKRGVAQRYNGIAHLPLPGDNFKRDGHFITDLELYITDLEAI